jgi:ubiquitin C-terminal hydrolase
MSVVNIPVQEMSIQQLNFQRLALHTQIAFSEIKKRKLSELIDQIVEIYNEAKADKEQYKPLEFNLASEFKLRTFAKIRKGKTRLVQRLQTGGKAKELPPNAGSDIVFFFYRTVPTHEIFAVTTGTAWHVVRPTISYKFPLQAVAKMLHPEKITEVARRCLVGPDTYEKLTNPEGHLFYRTESLYYLVESFICELKQNSSLVELGLFKQTPSVKVETGLMRILSKIPLESYPEILNLLSQHARNEKTYAADGSQEVADPLFEFLHFLQPARSKKENLDQELVRQIFTAHQNNRAQTCHVRHKYLTEFIYAESYEIQFAPKRKYQLLEHCPTLEEILDLIAGEREDAFESAENLYEALNDCSLRYNGGNQESLLAYLEGELRFENGSSYFKVRGMWYKLNVSHHSLLQQDFKAVLRKSLVKPENRVLTKPWIGNSKQGHVTQTSVNAILKLPKGIRAFMDTFKKTKVCYLDKDSVNQTRLVGEILKHPLVQKHREVIEKQILAKSELPSEGLLKKLLKEDFETVVKELKKLRPILNEKGFVINPFAYPLRKLLKDKYSEFVAFLEQQCLASATTEDEEAYNRSYLFTETPYGPDKGFLVLDQVCPENIEPADIIHYNENETRLMHVKETFGQPTRDACSQIVNAATKISGGLRLHQPAGYLELLWKLATQTEEKEGFRAKVKEQFLHLGERGFYDIFRKRKLIFVYAFLKNDNQSFQKEKEAPVYLSLDHLKDLKVDHAKLFQSLQKQQFLDPLGRLTGKFYASSKKKFIVEDFAQNSPEIYDLLSSYKSVSESTLAKFEILRTAEELRKLGFDFEICEIDKKKLDDPASQSQAASQTQGSPSSLEQELPSETPDLDDPATAPSQHKRDKVDNGPVGFVNIKNSCYMNATLQMLFNIPEVRASIEKNKAKNDLLKELFHLMGVTTSAEATRPHLIKFRDEVFERRGQGELPFGKEEQQDAHEFLQFILGQLKWQPFKTYTRITTTKQERYRLAETPGNHLQIPFENVNTLQEAVDDYFADEQMAAGGKIDPLELTINEEEKTFTKWTQTIQMESLPAHLILQLIRFNQRGVKIKKVLKFPPDQVIKIPFKGGVVDYEIVGYVNHLGHTCNSGHYTADLINHRDPKGKERAIHCDDETLSLVKPDNPGKDAYIITLRKK